MKQRNFVTTAVAALGVLCAFAPAAPAATISAGGSPYTGAINVRESSSFVRFTSPSGGMVTCSNATSGSPAPRLGSFGTGSISTSSITTTVGIKGSTALYFANPLLQKSSTIVHDSTTTVGAAPRCVSTSNFPTGGCTGQTTSPASISAVQSGSQVTLQLTGRITLSCFDSAGNSVTCGYSTGSSPGTLGPVNSNPITVPSAVPATAVFNAVPLFRASGSTLCPSTVTFTGSYQLYTGTVYPGGTPISLN